MSDLGLIKFITIYWCIPGKIARSTFYRLLFKFFFDFASSVHLNLNLIFIKVIPNIILTVACIINFNIVFNFIFYFVFSLILSKLHDYNFSSTLFWNYHDSESLNIPVDDLCTIQSEKDANQLKKKEENERTSSFAVPVSLRSICIRYPWATRCSYIELEFQISRERNVIYGTKEKKFLVPMSKTDVILTFPHHYEFLAF